MNQIIHEYSFDSFLGRMLEMMFNAPPNEGKLVTSNNASVHSQRYTNDSAF